MAKRRAARTGGRRSGGSTSRRTRVQAKSSSTRSGARSSAAARKASGGRKAAGSASRSPTAIRLLKQDHQEVSKLLERYEDSSGSSKTQIAQRICAALTVHAQIEEEILYPAARRALKEDDAELVAEANVEHASIKDLVSQIESASGSDELYDAKVKVLGEYVKHHVKEEETELFPKLQKTQLDLDALGKQLAQRKLELAGEQPDAGSADEEDSELEGSTAAVRSNKNRGSRPVASRMQQR